MIKIRNKNNGNITHINIRTGSVFINKIKQPNKTKKIWHRNNLYKFEYEEKEYLFYYNKCLSTNNKNIKLIFEKDYIQYNLYNNESEDLYKLKLVKYIRFYKEYAEDNFGNRLNINQVINIFNKSFLGISMYINKQNKYIAVRKGYDFYSNNKHFIFKNKKIINKNTEELGSTDKIIYLLNKKNKKIYKICKKQNILLKETKIKNSNIKIDVDGYYKILKIQTPNIYDTKNNDLIVYQYDYIKAITLLDLKNFNYIKIYKEDLIKEKILEIDNQEELIEFFKKTKLIQEFKEKLIKR